MAFDQAHCVSGVIARSPPEADDKAISWPARLLSGLLRRRPWRLAMTRGGASIRFDLADHWTVNLKVECQKITSDKRLAMRFFPLLLLLVLLVACETAPAPTGPMQAAPKPVSVQFYLIYETPGNNLVERTVEATGETILLAGRPDLTERDISWAQVQIDPLSSRPSVLVHFTPVGTDKLASLTRQNIGRRMAIIIDGRILATPLITSEIRDGRATIQGFKSVAEAQRVADSLAQR